MKGVSAPASVGRHFYKFYKGPEDLFRTVIPFLGAGLESGEACLWIISRSVGVLEAIAAMRLRFDLIRFLENGQLLILPAERWYLNRSRFSERKALERFRKFFQDRERLGFKAYRVVGDAGWLEERDWVKFQSYEKNSQQAIQTVKLLAICAYPIDHCSLGQTKDVVDNHDSAFLSKF